MASTQTPIYCNVFSEELLVMTVTGYMTRMPYAQTGWARHTPPPSLGRRPGCQSFCEDSLGVSGRKLRSWLLGVRWPAALPREVSSDAHRVSAGKAGRHCVCGLIAGVGGVAMMARWRSGHCARICPSLPHRQHLLSLVRL
jgi:hypothetical protein